MPAESKAQQMMAAIDLKRKREGQPTRTGMNESQLEEFASTKRKNLPYKVSKKKNNFRRGLGK